MKRTLVLLTITAAGIASGCCSTKPGYFGTGYAQPVLPQTYQAPPPPAIVQAPPPQIVQPQVQVVQPQVVQPQMVAAAPQQVVCPPVCQPVYCCQPAVCQTVESTY